MSWHLRVRPEAELDLLLAAAWYQDQQAGLGERFLEELFALVDSLRNNALIYARVGARTRCAFARRFPYVVTYQLEESTVIVLSVMHARRQPAR